MFPRMLRSALRLALLTLLVSACSDPGFVDPELNEEYGKPLLDPPPSSGKEDSVTGIGGPKLAAENSSTAVWEVTQQWSDRDTPAAREAGIAWPEDSSLDWNEKYALWITAMPQIEGDGYGMTMELTTPWGFHIKPPVLECAEVSVFLRVSFASWYGLPFYISAWSNGSNLHFGHFGIWRTSAREPNFPKFRDRYEDFSWMTPEEVAVVWPEDESLQKRKLSTAGDDVNAWLGEEAYSGAYFDHIFLNKRVGHFMMYILSYTGSVHLASTDNTFNIEAKSTRPGDTLLKRWQKHGIGHTMVVKTVNPIPETDGLFEAELMSGSMPRRQPRWNSAGSSKYSFTSPQTGGEGANSVGAPYVELGGGMKRWRVAEVIDGRWRNTVPESDQDIFIPFWDQDRLKARPGQFAELLTELTGEMKVAILVQIIEEKRAHLRQFPASCSARIARETAFDDLYEVAATELSTPTTPGLSRLEVDQLYRKLEDYVFAELVYDQSRTCCWNSSTEHMYDIIMDYNEALVQSAEEGSCVAPLVFKMVDGGYANFQAHAESIGVADYWVPWSADEPCAQESTVTTDTEEEHRWSSYCDVFSASPEP